MARLVKASLQPPAGLDAFLRELGAGESGFGGTDYDPIHETLADFLQRLIDRDSGDNLPAGFVPATTFWLVDDQGEIAGMSRLRHELNEMLLHHGGHIGYYIRATARGKGNGNEVLRLTLDEGRKLGIQRFLLTVKSTNLRSIRVIEHNGGVLEDERPEDDGTGHTFRRYWIG